MTLVSGTAAVLYATNNNITRLLKEELLVSERIFLTLLNDNSAQLKNRAEILADDFAFKNAVATNERDTVISVLANHANRINADMVLLVSKNKDIEVTSHNLSPMVKKLRERLDPNKSVDFLVISNSQPFLVVFVPVKTPDLIGWVGLGFSINQSLLDHLKGLTNQDITLIYQTTLNSENNTISTLKGNVQSKPNVSVDINQYIKEMIKILSNGGQITRSFQLLKEENQQIIGILSSSIDEAMRSYNPMRIQMVLIGLISLAFAAIGAFLISKGVTRPINYLVKSAKRISNGDYSQPVHLSSSQEFNVLGSTLELMQQTVHEREGRIKHQSRHDMLTQLPNRYSIFSTINNRIAEKTANMQFGLGLLNIDNLPSLTDMYGSEFSDQLLKKVAERLSHSLRRGDIASRIGDMQFLIFFDGMSHSGIDKVADKLVKLIQQPINTNTITVNLEPSLGFVLCPQHGGIFDDLLRRAQIALQKCSAPKRFYSVYEIGQDEIHLRQIKVTHRLQYAIKNRSFQLYYQPKYDLKKGEINQLEALIRWTDTELGPMYPDEFIMLAEHSGDITKISSIVLDMVLEQLMSWRNNEQQLAISINLSGVDIAKKEFITDLISRFNETGLDSKLLVIEITETVMMVDLETSLSNLEKLKAAGFSISVDDFGTGFSSLSQLKVLPAAELKIDKSLILSLDESQSDQLIVRSTIEMGHHLGLRIVAEGVENIESAILLNNMGCDAIQGYYLAKAMPVIALEDWLKNPPDQLKTLRSPTFNC